MVGLWLECKFLRLGNAFSFRNFGTFVCSAHTHLSLFLSSFLLLFPLLCQFNKHPSLLAMLSASLFIIILSFLSPIRYSFSCIVLFLLHSIELSTDSCLDIIVFELLEATAFSILPFYVLSFASVSKYTCATSTAARPQQQKNGKRWIKTCKIIRGGWIDCRLTFLHPKKGNIASERERERDMTLELHE